MFAVREDGRLYNFTVDYLGENYKLLNVNSSGYRYEDLLDDLCDKVLKHVHDIDHMWLSMSYSEKDDPSKRIILERNDNTISKMFKKYSDTGEIDLFVKSLEDQDYNQLDDTEDDKGDDEADLNSEDSDFVANSAGESDVPQVSCDDEDDDCLDSDGNLSEYESDDHCEPMHNSEEEFGDDPWSGRLGRDEEEFHLEPEKKIKLGTGMVFSDIHAFRNAL
ncbi:hypothetical protein Salat_0918700 [Sesamum alatum]|uniref:Uncharacterized protein n=1 Tax=Sesamum alatum TaxID=300844 RepID=A0AAE1YKT8_9LAMI|nr:hypothetical protein Salat_0918700 [Sesamum alatum]